MESLVIISVVIGFISIPALSIFSLLDQTRSRAEDERRREAHNSAMAAIRSRHSS